MAENMYTVAEAYVNRGWSVLPVRPEEKRPFMQNWLQFTKTRPDRALVTSWFTALSGAGVGVVTGRVSNMVVLDVEHHCTVPIEEILKRYPTDMVARTGGGGYHLFYQYPQSVSRVSNRVRIFDGADLRADGGFIVLPPTIHPNGTRYEWTREGAMGTFPMALLDLRSQPSTQNDGWITETLRGVTEGGRNDACARLAGYFLKKGVTEDIVESLLVEWNERNDPPLPLREIRTTIKSVSRYHSGAGNQFTRVDFTDDTSTPSTAPNSNRSAFDVLKLRDYITGYGDGGATWLIDKWLPDKSITFLISPPESYKTWILLDLAVSVAMNKPFLGQFEIMKPGPTLVIQQEDGHSGLVDRISLIMACKSGLTPKLEGTEWCVPVMPDAPVYIHPSRMLRFDNQRVLEELEELIKSIRPRVVMIDPLYSATSVENYMAASAEQMMILKTWRDKYGCSFVIAHHSKKNVDPDSTAREDSWGSQFLNAFLEAGWQIRRNPRLQENEVVVRRHSKVMGNQPPMSLAFDISTQYPLRYSVAVKPYESATSTGVSLPAQAAMLDMFAGGPMSQGDIARATGKAKSTVSRQIKQMEAAGLIQRMPDNRYRAVNNER